MCISNTRLAGFASGLQAVFDVFKGGGVIQYIVCFCKQHDGVSAASSLSTSVEQLCLLSSFSRSQLII